MVTLNYDLSSDIKLTVDFCAEKLYAEIKSNSELIKSAIIWRQSKLIERMKSLKRSDGTPTFSVKDGNIMINFNSSENLVKFSQWLKSDMAKKQLLNSITELKESRGELDNVREIENLIRYSHEF